MKPTYQYYITLKTSGQSYIFTNFYVNQAYQGITIKVHFCLIVSFPKGKKTPWRLRSNIPNSWHRKSNKSICTLDSNISTMTKAVSDSLRQMSEVMIFPRQESLDLSSSKMELEKTQSSSREMVNLELYSLKIKPVQLFISLRGILQVVKLLDLPIQFGSYKFAQRPISLRYGGQLSKYQGLGKYSFNFRTDYLELGAIFPHIFCILHFQRLCLAVSSQIRSGKEKNKTR